MPKALYKQQIKELQTLKKDGKKAALMGEKIIDSKIKRLKTMQTLNSPKNFS